MRRWMVWLVLGVVLFSLAACEAVTAEMDEPPSATEELEDHDHTIDEEDETSDMLEETDEEVLTEERVMVDMAGREVTVPPKIKKVFGTNNTSAILLYTLAPDMLIGWNNKLGEEALAFIPDAYKKLPVLGNMYGSGKEASAEEVLSLAPDVVLIASTKKNDKIVSDTDALQEKLGVPVAVIIANMDNYDKAYAFLGELIGEEARAQELAAYYTETIAYAAEKRTAVTDPASVYYARMDNGLTTEFAGSPNAELLELVGAVNIAESDGKETAAEVSIEQVMVWNPEVILIGHIGQSESKAMDAIMSDESWAQIGAVQTGNVISTPRLPFNWFDRPPSVNRIIGVYWLGNALYPDVFDLDMVAETKEFFSLFYGIELSTEQASELIG